MTSRRLQIRHKTSNRSFGPVTCTEMIERISGPSWKNLKLRLLTWIFVFRAFQTIRTTAGCEPECLTLSRRPTGKPRRWSKTYQSARSSAPRCRRLDTNRTRWWPCPTVIWPRPPTIIITTVCNPPCGTRAASTAGWVSRTFCFTNFSTPKSRFCHARFENLRSLATRK